MRFKTDENLPLEVREALRSAGHDASTVVEEGLVGQQDTAVAAACRSEGRAIVTLDKHFADMRAFPPQNHAGVIVLRSTLQGNAAIMRLFSKVLPLLATEPLTGYLWIVDETKVRVRKEDTP
jgi:predicted nuclease of predicted toxin-antitoxin system